ncbi:ribonuclease Oy-like [Cotesia glomerata]|uniref:ribonuclease Oy-like n=1 Tax=Cotesia glomerata TaxID=32391 RepID=UPI001D023263|nr:ribonuclease Oy-like [Cotesia glomerata]
MHVLLLENSEEHNNFDYFILTQMWPPTFCYSWRLLSSKNTCRLPRKKIWTIHGFWPAITQTSGPNYCSEKWKLNLDLLEEIQQELDTKWIDVKNNTDPHSFLKYEWAKHGTCAVSHPKLNNELKYFKNTLEMFNSFDATKILTKAGFHAGGKYFVQDLIKSIESFTGKNCRIDCIFDVSL